jgi:hypothetical protein
VSSRQVTGTSTRSPLSAMDHQRQRRPRRARADHVIGLGAVDGSASGG